MSKKMETNTCDVYYLDADALLPPRKRLLAGLKRQSSDVSSPVPSTLNGIGSDYSNRLSNLLRSQLSNPNLSNEEIVEAFRCAALEASNISEATRAKAEEKAAKAAKAVAAAKRALEVVAALSENTTTKEKYPKKNKMKKHVPVQALYNNKKGSTNGKTDEEVAQNLHRVINSSLRIPKNSGFDLKNRKHKRLKISTSEKSSINNGDRIAQGLRPETNISYGNGIVNAEGPVMGAGMILVDLNGSKSDKGDQLSSINDEAKKADQLKLGNGELEPVHKFIESLDSVGKKRGKMKQKKLPLSICSIRDETSSPKDELKSRGVQQWGEMTRQPLFSGGSANRSRQLPHLSKTKLCSHSVVV